jgi:multidrug efflux pump
LRGAREIGFTVISLTVSLIAVFIPLLFMTGIVGRMFREFALTLTIAVITSAIVSLTLTPMMCSRLLRTSPPRASNFVSRAFTGAVDRSVALYQLSLEWVLRHQTATLLVTTATLVATIWLYIIIPKGFLPAQDTGMIMAVTEAGQDISFSEMQKLQERVAQALRQDPDVTGVASIIGVTPVNATPNAGRLMIALRPRDAREAFVTSVVERLKKLVGPIPGVQVYFQPVQDIQIGTRLSRAQYQYTLAGTDADEVLTWTDRLAQRLQASPLMRDVASEVQDRGLRTLINVDREKAGRLGISMQIVNDTLNDAFGQRQISTIYGQANQYRVILEAAPEYQRDPASLAKLYVPAAAATQPVPVSSTQTTTTAFASPTPAAQVPLSVIATVERTIAPLVVMHDEQFPAATISFNLAGDASLGEAIAAVQAAEREIGMPSSIIGSYAGDAAEFSRSLAGEPWLILAAAITIYIVLGVLYESFIHPLTILSTLPSAGVGALLALMLFRHDLSIVALIGIVLLMGIVKKNAIMMIDFALDAEREAKLSARDAIVQAAMLRFRPIMMTTLAALFGALPLALESGTGSELRFPLGITIIGGLLISQLLTLYTTPVIYLALDRLRARAARPRRQPVSWPAE